MSFLDEARTGELWAKVKAALSSKQSKLTGTAGQVVGFGADGAAEAVQGWSNPNLLINWYFPGPVNQKTKMEYAGKGYTIDCWKDRYVSGDGIKELTSEGIHLKPGFKTNGLVQDFETFKHLSGKTVTFSVLVPSVSGTLRAHIAGYDSNDTYQTLKSLDLSAPGILQLTTTLPDISDYLEFFARIFNVTAGTDSVIAAAKLELGPHQTLAHQDADGDWVLNDPPPNKALELLKCQRYQIAIDIPGINYEPIGIGVARSPNNANITVPLPVSLRAKPAVVYSGDFFLFGAVEGGSTTTHAITNIVVDAVSNNCVMLDIAVSGTLVPGSSYNLQADAKNDNKLLLDANL